MTNIISFTNTNQIFNKENCIFFLNLLIVNEKNLCFEGLVWSVLFGGGGLGGELEGGGWWFKRQKRKQSAFIFCLWPVAHPD